MIPVKVDLSDIASEFSLSLNQTRTMLELVTKTMVLKIANAWDNQAALHLHSTRTEYRRSLIIVDKGRFEGWIVLQGILPNMLESGVSAFDMKVGFSKSDKIKYSKKGLWYLTIPFRYSTPGAIGESSLFSGSLPQEVYDAVRNNKGKALSQSQVPAPHNKIHSREKIVDGGRIFQEYKAKASIYAGMQKNSKYYDKVVQSQYTTFRRVGELSDMDMFIHKGLVAQNLAQRALDSLNIGEEVDRIVDSYLDSILN